MRRVLLVALLGKSDRVERELSDVRCKREDGRKAAECLFFVGKIVSLQRISK